jgi:putative FmdB family regulatory protein
VPTYEYECKQCSLRFEIKKHFGENGSAPCPRCGCESRRVFSPALIIFKGSGFYVTDNKNGFDKSDIGKKGKTD